MVFLEEDALVLLLRSVVLALVVAELLVVEPVVAAAANSKAGKGFTGCVVRRCGVRRGRRRSKRNGRDAGDGISGSMVVSAMASATYADDRKTSKAANVAILPGKAARRRSAKNHCCMLTNPSSFGRFGSPIFSIAGFFLRPFPYRPHWGRAVNRFRRLWSLYQTAATSHKFGPNGGKVLQWSDPV